MEEQKEKFKSGYVAILGRPNVGKSTLLNSFLGTKVAIVTDKPQTTRHRIIGVKHLKDAQIVFLDTPGIHKEKFELNRYMNEIAFGVIPDADIILFLIDARSGFTEVDKKILQKIGEEKRKDTKVIVVINKIDGVPKEELLPLIDEIHKEFPFVSDIVPLSATRGTNLDRLLDLLVKYLPEGPKYYEDHMLTDMPLEQYVAEIIREKIMLLTREEVPHAVTVQVLNIQPGDKDPNMLVIDADIVVEKDSQKAIVIGKGGQRLKRIGKLAREELEQLLGKRVYLRLWVKVKEGWRDRLDQLRGLGYSY
ncbi:GTP-binding protein Era-like-protein [Desulfurobacterium thermolithotrophum DSM 11699]|uniref:GTPase Era n=1 Tax=Desulfurobacterium thermolithotrophum (strain DSM 11699 / BSA) TaxID=868864 RepID=F0S3R3_DESTD|nr:GTPase Era [Desulfurobacterium thermolithotrophum]ADY73485.1 GTP-binding protein Era-like-protein [Desulfurobacterium thermolithotrophum DSM 11699]